MIGVQILAYKQEEYLSYCIRALYPYVDLIQVMFSTVPFTAYNPTSRHEFSSIDRTEEILRSFPDTKSKLDIAKGVWNDEESMRQEALDRLSKRGCHLCLIIDADEFWPDDMLHTLITYIDSHISVGQVAWASQRHLFKRFDRMVDCPSAKLPVAIHCHRDIHFIDRRVPSGERILLPSLFFFWHLGYVLGNQRMLEKIRTFSHAAKVPESWYEEKWLAFTPETTNLCRSHPARWPRTVQIDPWELPQILLMHPFFPNGAC